MVEAARTVAIPIRRRTVSISTATVVTGATIHAEPEDVQSRATSVSQVERWVMTKSSSARSARTVVPSSVTESKDFRNTITLTVSAAVGPRSPDVGRGLGLQLFGVNPRRLPRSMTPTKVIARSGTGLRVAKIVSRLRRSRRRTDWAACYGDVIRSE